ncbi:uncharacterized protein EV422DRAFT_429727 [Fimicolochytrium jonesii]|uniref:uncharacterized protein n=1 Tax=Fimicolochytrium jonesii TaxID=1396493 RepID=UPI0022FE56D0|nr:uncharacterized protein EV422DRAFT_429727 [Fimicolochytrium jonesii]KAI8821729.1 hypothetical protein EV422DRAFT_429727 [Fimicolochytrium jonesii]
MMWTRLQIVFGGYTVAQLTCIYYTLLTLRHSPATTTKPPTLLLLPLLFSLLLRDLTTTLSPHLPLHLLHTLSLTNTLLAALLTPTVILIAYELCHTLHGGPRRRLLYHDQFGRIAAVLAASALFVYDMSEFVAEKDSLVLKERLGLPGYEVEDGARAVKVAEYAGTVMLVLAGGCLWARTGYPWLSLLQGAILLGRVSTATSAGPYTPLLTSSWSLILSISLTTALSHTIQHAKDPADSPHSQHLLTDDDLRWYGTLGGDEAGSGPGSPAGKKSGTSTPGELAGGAGQGVERVGSDWTVVEVEEGK